MSRSNPSTNTPHPCTRWHEWNGEHGTIRSWDKAAKAEVITSLPFAFMALDRTATIAGWNDASDSRIFSNEVRDTTREPFVVKAHKGGVLAQGCYREIKDKVGSLGGHFTANIYIAFKDDSGALQLGAMQLKGAALKAWTDFEQTNRKAVYEKAVVISGFDEGKKGKVVFRTPKFSIKPVSEEANAAAVELDKVLQTHLESYFKRNTTEQAAPAATTPANEPQPDAPPADWEPEVAPPVNEDDAPF